VVRVECGIARRSEQVTTWVTAHDIVNTAVRTNLNIGNTLGEEAVFRDVVFLEQVCPFCKQMSF
jgi:hypothetical protein